MEQPILETARLLLRPFTLSDAADVQYLAITRRMDGVLLGAISLMEISVRHRRAELGYWLGVPYWNRGYMTEAAAALVSYGFAELGLHKITASHFVRNPASGRVMQKLGMTQEGLLRQDAHKGDSFEDMVLYGLLAAEWSGETRA